jgi:membrane protease YdiL (CAAX protease family)
MLRVSTSRGKGDMNHSTQVAGGWTGSVSAKAVGIVLTFGLAAMLTQLRAAELAPSASFVVQRLIGEAGWWMLGLAVLAWVVRAEGENVTSIGLKALSWRCIGWGIGGFLGLLAIFILAQTLVAAVGAQAPSAALSFADVPAWLIVLMAFRAGVVEEILFRGYAITRLEVLTGRTWVAATASVVVFVALHAGSWSASHLLFVSLAGGALTGLYLWHRNLTANIIAHTIFDVAGLLLAKYAAAGG